MKVCYVLPSLFPCGGNKICIEHLTRLAESGVDCYLSVASQQSESDIPNWFDFGTLTRIPFDRAELEKMDVVVATMWDVVLRLDQINLNGPRLFSFIQLPDAMMEEEGSPTQNAIYSTYTNSRFELITEARWIKMWLREVSGREAHFIPNRLETQDTSSFSKTDRKKPIVLLEANAGFEPKNAINGMTAMELLKDECEIHWLTNTAHELPPHLDKLIDKKHQRVLWKDALEAIWNADVFVKPSLMEGQSSTIMEAMAMGTPVVAYDIPSTYEVAVADHDALVVPADSIYALANAVRKILKVEGLEHNLITNGIGF